MSWDEARASVYSSYEQIVGLIKDYREGPSMLVGGVSLDTQVSAHIMSVVAETGASPLLATEAIILGVQRGDLQAALELAREELGENVDGEELRDFVFELIFVP